MTEWQILARGEDGVGVARCPEGHIHLELERGEYTLRFDDARFLAFGRTVAIAASALAGHTQLNLFEIRRDNPCSFLQFHLASQTLSSSATLDRHLGCWFTDTRAQTDSPGILNNSDPARLVEDSTARELSPCSP